MVCILQKEIPVELLVGFSPLEYDEGASTNTTSLRSFCTQEPSVKMVSQRPHQQFRLEAWKQEDAAISAMRMGCHKDNLLQLILPLPKNKILKGSSPLFLLQMDTVFAGLTGVFNCLPTTPDSVEGKKLAGCWQVAGRLLALCHKDLADCWPCSARP